jgi:glucose dehydrogenase
MAGGLVYMSTGPGTVAALDAATGKVVWLQTPPTTPGPPSAANRGVAYWSDGQDARIITVTGAFLVALNAKTGEPYPSFGANGQVDLRLGLSRAFDGYSWRSAPLVVRNVIVVGSVVPDINSAARPVTMEAPPGDRPRLRRAQRQAAVDVPHDSAARRSRQRDVGERFLGLHRARQRVGHDER